MVSAKRNLWANGELRGREGSVVKNRGMSKLTAGMIGLIAGFLAGAILGLVIGGTFLGGLDIYERIGLEGYELAAYVGAVIGGTAGLLFGIRRAG